jgi:hypothetical protein
MFKWFDASQATELGHSLATFLVERVPAQSFPAGDRKALGKALEVVAKMQSQIDRFRASHTLNMYQKAKMANAFQWKLFELGYDKAAVAEVAKELVRRL